MDKRKQWHPVFAHLLGLLIRDYYEIQPEVPVGDLPRRGDLLVIRRQPGPDPPFVGLWANLATRTSSSSKARRTTRRRTTSNFWSTSAPG